MSTLIETSSFKKIIGYSLLVGLSFGPVSETSDRVYDLTEHREHS